MIAIIAAVAAAAAAVLSLPLVTMITSAMYSSTCLCRLQRVTSARDAS